MVRSVSYGCRSAVITPMGGAERLTYCTTAYTLWMLQVFSMAVGVTVPGPAHVQVTRFFFAVGMCVWGGGGDQSGRWYGCTGLGRGDIAAKPGFQLR
jgi:hypothetical protein